MRADRIAFFSLLGRKKIHAKLSEVKLIRAGKPVTSKVTRYVFTAAGKSFYFSGDISDVERLLKLLGVEKA